MSGSFSCHLKLSRSLPSLKSPVYRVISHYSFTIIAYIQPSDQVSTLLLPLRKCMCGSFCFLTSAQALITQASSTITCFGLVVLSRKFSLSNELMRVKLAPLKGYEAYISNLSPSSFALTKGQHQKMRAL